MSKPFDTAADKVKLILLHGIRHHDTPVSKRVSNLSRHKLGRDRYTHTEQGKDRESEMEEGKETDRSDRHIHFLFSFSQFFHDSAS